MILTELYKDSNLARSLCEALDTERARIHVDGMTGSMPAAVIAAMALLRPTASQMVIAPTKEDAFYMQNDLESLLGTENGERRTENEERGTENGEWRTLNGKQKTENGAAAPGSSQFSALSSPHSVLLFPTSYRKAYNYDPESTENANMMMRTEVLKELSTGRPVVVVTYAAALCEKVPTSRTVGRNMVHIAKGEKRDLWDLADRLQELGFEREDFVVEPGQYAVRGGIVDVWSMASEMPYRLEFFDDTVDSLRTYNAATQLSVKQVDRVEIVGNPTGSGQSAAAPEPRPADHSPLTTLLTYFSSSDVVWTPSLMMAAQQMDGQLAEVQRAYEARRADTAHPIVGTLPQPEALACSVNEFLQALLELRIVEYGNSHYFTQAVRIDAHSEPQPAFGKQLDMLRQNLKDHLEQGYRTIITASNESQQRRLEKALGVENGERRTENGERRMENGERRMENGERRMENGERRMENLVPHPDSSQFSVLSSQFATFNLSHGFVDHDLKLLCYTDHEIFERYHKYTVHDLRATHEAMTLKELFELKPGDYVTHIDYGVGRFSGLEKVTKDGKSQELIRLIYKNNDVLYISIHGLHKISRYVGREGEAPQLNRLGSNTWQVLKQKTKRQVKDIARDLIALYAKRKASAGFAFSADSYLQNELEASFAYEDTPDQQKASVAVKRDMESRAPMDRLVCGDVGFGKTEVAIRAAFKACCDSKQVAVLVPSTVLAFQHYNTFSQRLKGMPVRVDYLNRFRTAKEKTQIYKDVADGKIDILIGTHAITNKQLKFKDLGLLIVDEEQKFGVSVKEKLKEMKTGVDCLTLTATPIPRTLQFSLMGARDLSVIQTLPPNRQPIETELSDFNEELIRDAIMYEMSRGGQTFFISNRVENMPEMAGLVQRLVPDARVAIAHGRMDGKEAEETLMRFLEGEVDVLVATSIVENGLDIPNANTMIINNAHQFGLSDLHQMRGRVGRSNKKAFCYLLIPSYLTLTPDAQRRLKAIEEFSTIGSGFNIAMRDLDIRGAGNILGAEQSGFISEIGYDMYHKILNEAIEELKESDFKELFAAEAEETKEYVRECTIETDLEVLLPDDYVTNVSERLFLYRELSDLQTEEELAEYRKRLTDRFGPLPQATEELIRTITLRRMAKEFGIEKIVLKQGRMVLHLVSNPQSPFYQSANFPRLIQYAQENPTRAHLKDSGERLTISVDKVPTIDEALHQMESLTK
ncbi:MAG: transcription-repair coupling factor [Bacteroidales bacterium]|nr:transcription-repair coupling factor [Bacteroidales bacterium]